MPRPCTICTSQHAQAVQQAAVAGEADQAIADRFGFSRAAVGRHRRDHIEAQARLVAQAAGRGHVERQQRQALQQATAAEPEVWLALDAITKDLRRVHDRLDQAADEAADAGQMMAVSALSGQLIRATEVRAKLGGVGQPDPGAGGAGGFHLTINLRNGDGTAVPVTIEGSAVPALAGE